MADKRPPYDRRKTAPKLRAALPPIATPSQDDIETLVPCPTCEGVGMVSASVREAVHALGTPVVVEREFSVADEDEDPEPEPPKAA